MQRSWIVSIVSIALGAVCAGWAQTQTPAVPAFDVVSIKASTANGNQDKTTPGTIVETGETLRQLVTIALQVKDTQVTGGPPWIDSERYDIVAKASGPVNDRQLFQMLQHLLEERFHLRVHTESKTSSGYALVATKNGIKAKPAADPDHPSRGSFNGTLTAKAVSMAQLAEWLGRRTGVPVADSTGLSALYDFTLKWDPAADRADPLAPAAANPAAPDPKNLPLPLALQEQLGLKLEARKVAMQIIVIDSAGKPVLD